LQVVWQVPAQRRNERRSGAAYVHILICSFVGGYVFLASRTTMTQSPFSPLRHKTFRGGWAATVVSNFGGLIQAVGVAWLMTSLTSSASLVALVQTSTTLPIMLFSLAAGAISDNYDKRTVMLVAQTVLLTVSIVLAGCTYYGLITPWSLLIFHFSDRYRDGPQQPSLAVIRT
jgi:hypothetical protein